MNSRRETSENELTSFGYQVVERRQISSRNCFIDREKPWLYQKKILQKYRRTGRVANIPGRGRKEILSATAKGKIIRSVKKNPLLSAPNLASSISSEIWEKISAETVRRVLHNAGFHGRTPVRKPLINCVNRKNRLPFAKEHISKPESFWNTVIFSDESKFNLYRSDGQYKVWRQVGKELDPKNTIKRV
ncbi:transposable element Tc1 transposase [Trichonephila clavipes]|nr:transposable element Tc1 transposase [Trichonephila clavipes]